MSDIAEKVQINLTLSSWQLAQVERLVERAVQDLKRDGMTNHAVTQSMIELEKVLNNARSN